MLGLGVNSVTVVLLSVAPFLTDAMMAHLALLQASLGGCEYLIGRERVWQRLGEAAAPFVVIAAEAEAIARLELEPGTLIEAPLEKMTAPVNGPEA